MIHRKKTILTSWASYNYPETEMYVTIKIYKKENELKKLSREEHQQIVDNLNSVMNLIVNNCRNLEVGKLPFMIIWLANPLLN
jgi:hypothetical protein